MKVQKAQIKKIITEEIGRALAEASQDDTVEVEIGEAPQLYYHGAGTRANTPERKEAKALFDHFFGRHHPDALEFMMQHDSELEEIIVQLYGWDLFGYRRSYPEPGRDVVFMAREFKDEGKDIFNNEGEFLRRLEKHQFTKGKEAFDQAIRGGEESAVPDVPVGRAATPGTEEYEDLQRLMKLANTGSRDDKTGNTVFAPRWKRR